ncbi:hypothetical protein [Gulosibacter faecalis]|jgi:hypothetical protein|uniref:Uncharacterized protein n=1 Tax=Gulosibacter faecalis TaxID=272240 RepID=A0ABW5UXI8_9MICO|nr:hypothetical protein [Gulosibacter faecalis]
MEIFFAGIFGIVIGLAALALARPREAVGSALLPALGGIVALAWWVIATWGAALLGLGWLRYDAFWIWALLVVITAAVCIPTAIALPRSRAAGDADLLDRLSHRTRLRA